MPGEFRIAEESSEMMTWLEEATVFPEGVRVRREGTLKLTWVPERYAYSAMLNGHLLGLVRCALPFPFRLVVEFV